MSVLGFFTIKLSMGTAQMSTSIVRMPRRPPRRRALGFFYGHVGFYLAQLQLTSRTRCTARLLRRPRRRLRAAPRHAKAGGALSRPCTARCTASSSSPPWRRSSRRCSPRRRCSPPSSRRCARRARLALFFAIRAVHRPLPVLGVRARRRNTHPHQPIRLAIEHQPFHVLYHGFASPVYYPRRARRANIVLAAVVSPVGVGWASLGFGAIMPLALLYGPALFTRGCSRSSCRHATSGRGRSLVDDGPKG